MPGFDGTGPSGEGPMTGGARGYCNPAWAGARPPMYGRGFGYGPGGFGRGRGRGFRRGFGRWFGFGRGFDWGGYFPGRGRGHAPGYSKPYPMTPSEELNIHKADADALKGDLDEINRRIEELEKEPSEKS